jgi:hypothetical protein
LAVGLLWARYLFPQLWRMQSFEELGERRADSS